MALLEPNGLVAVGGRLTSERLIKAYSLGIFPWFNEDEPTLWYSESKDDFESPTFPHF